MSLPALNRTLLFAVLLLAPLSARADDTPHAEGENATAFSERMARCVSNLSSPDLDVRRAASEELQQAGVGALPALEEGAADSQRARSVGCFNLIQRLVNSDDEDTSTRALEAVQRLSGSEEADVAGRANSILASTSLTGESTAIALLEAAGCRVRRQPSGEVAYVTGIGSDRELALLKSLSFGRVSMLMMSGAGITDEGLKHLSGVAAARSLTILNSSITDAGLKTLSELQNVDSLTLGAGNFTAEGLRQLGRTSAFRSLTMHEVASEHLPVLGEMPQLQILGLNNLQLSERDVRLLNELDEVNVSLELDEATDEDLRKVSELRTLRALDINPRNTVTDAGIANLSGLSLERLTINAPQLSDEALLHIGKIESLEVLSLRDMQVSDSGLEHLRGLNNLRLLMLHRTIVTDEALQSLSEALPNLSFPNRLPNQRLAPRPATRPPELTERERELNQQLAEILNEDERDALNELTRREQLRSEVSVTVNLDDGLVNLHFRRNLRPDDPDLLKRISKLGTLFFSPSSAPVTDADLNLLKGIGMRGLAVWRSPVTDKGLAELTRCPNLASLSLMETQVTDAGLAHLREMPSLTELSLQTGSFTDAGLAHVSRLNQLVSLNLFRCNNLTADSLHHLSSLVNLERLLLNNIDGLNSASLVHLRGLKKLKRLEIDGMEVDPSDLAQLNSLSNLETLAVNSTNLTDEGLEHVIQLPALTALNISKTDITDAGLATLAARRNWTELGLSETNVTDVGLAHLAGMDQMTRLGLSNTSVTDAGLVHLKDITRMQSLSLEGTLIGDQGLGFLAGMEVLESLRLEGTQITDAGLNRLAQLESLSFLTVGATSVTPAGVDRFQQQLPDCRIISRDLDSQRDEVRRRLEELRESRENLRRRLPLPPATR